MTILRIAIAWVALYLSLPFLMYTAEGLEGLMTIKVAGDRYSFNTLQWTGILSNRLAIASSRCRFLSVSKGQDVEFLYSIQDNPVNITDTGISRATQFRDLCNANPHLLPRYVVDEVYVENEPMAEVATGGGVWYSDAKYIVLIMFGSLCIVCCALSCVVCLVFVVVWLPFFVARDSGRTAFYIRRRWKARSERKALMKAAEEEERAAAEEAAKKAASKPALASSAKAAQEPSRSLASTSTSSSYSDSESTPSSVSKSQSSASSTKHSSSSSKSKSEESDKHSESSDSSSESSSESSHS